MDEFWGVTILLFIILTLFVASLVRAMSYYKKYHLVRHKRVCLTKQISTLKSGDIILFIAHTHGFTNSLFTWDLYSHAGIVVEIDNELYLSESTVDSLPDATEGELMLPYSSQINPLYRRLKYYPGMKFLMQLKQPLTPEQESILQERAKLYVPYPSIIQMFKAILNFPVHLKARHCMQHVAWLLDEINLTPVYQLKKGKTFLETGFLGSSRAVTSLPGEPLGDGLNCYNETVELLYDLDSK